MDNSERTSHIRTSSRRRYRIPRLSQESNNQPSHQTPLSVEQNVRNNVPEILPSASPTLFVFGQPSTSQQLPSQGGQLSFLPNTSTSAPKEVSQPVQSTPPQAGESNGPFTTTGMGDTAVQESSTTPATEAASIHFMSCAVSGQATPLRSWLQTEKAQHISRQHIPRRAQNPDSKCNTKEQSTMESGFGVRSVTSIPGTSMQAALPVRSTSGISKTALEVNGKPPGYDFSGPLYTGNRSIHQPSTSGVINPKPGQSEATTSKVPIALTGTMVKFACCTGSDITVTAGLTENVVTKYQCLTFMKMYANKAFEELRWEDYQNPSKGYLWPSIQDTSRFGAPQQSQPEAKFEFGVNNNQQQTTSPGVLVYGTQSTGFELPPNNQQSLGFVFPPPSQQSGSGTQPDRFVSSQPSQPISGSQPERFVFPQPSQQSSSGTQPERFAFPQPSQQSVPGTQPERFVFPQPNQPSSGTQPERFVFPQPIQPSSGTQPEGFVFPQPNQPSSGTQPEKFVFPQPSTGTQPERFVFPQPSQQPSSGTQPERFVFPQPSQQPSSGTQPEKFVFPQLSQQFGPGEQPGFVFPQPSQQSGGFVFPQPSQQPSSGTQPGGFVFPQPSSGTQTGGFVFPQPNQQPSSGTQPGGFIFSQPTQNPISGPVFDVTGPQPPGFACCQPNQHPGVQPEHFVYPQPGPHYGPGYLYPQPYQEPAGFVYPQPYYGMPPCGFACNQPSPFYPCYGPQSGGPIFINPSQVCSGLETQPEGFVHPPGQPYFICVTPNGGFIFGSTGGSSEPTQSRRRLLSPLFSSDNLDVKQSSETSPFGEYDYLRGLKPLTSSETTYHYGRTEPETVTNRKLTPVIKRVSTYPTTYKRNSCFENGVEYLSDLNFFNRASPKRLKLRPIKSNPHTLDGIFSGMNLSDIPCNLSQSIADANEIGNNKIGPTFVGKRNLSPQNYGPYDNKVTTSEPSERRTGTRDTRHGPRSSRRRRRSRRTDNERESQSSGFGLLSTLSSIKKTILKSLFGSATEHPESQSPEPSEAGPSYTRTNSPKPEPVFRKARSSYTITTSTQSEPVSPENESFEAGPSYTTISSRKPEPDSPNVIYADVTVRPSRDSEPELTKSGTSEETPRQKNSDNYTSFTKQDFIISGLEEESSRDLKYETANCGVILMRTEYYTIPPLEELDRFKRRDGSCIISGFTVGRMGYGCVLFPDLMDVSNLNLDRLVEINHREVIVYPDDVSKPPVGHELNRRGRITLDRVFPKAKDTGSLITNIDILIETKFCDVLKKTCERQGAKFIDYCPETGSWVFEVEHFSKYGFNDRQPEWNDDFV